MAGYVGRCTDTADRRELAEVIDHYRRALLPLILPVRLLRHYALKFEIQYLRQQSYLHVYHHELLR
jgi:uncharacterized protein YbgA (DUF1722 family)